MATILDIWEEGDRETSVESTGRGPVRNHTMYFACQVAEGDEAIDFAEIFDDPRVPARGSLCPWDFTSICRKRRIKQNSETPNLFQIVIEYSNQALAGEEPDRTEEDNPLAHPADVSWDSEEVREAITKDLDNKPIINSAMQRFETAVEIVRRRRVITIVKNFATWNDTIAEVYEECVNSVAFLGKPAGEVYCRRISARRVFGSNIYYYPVTFVFVWDRFGWKTRVVDIGNAELVSTSPMKWKEINYTSGQGNVGGVLLNGSGLRATGNPPTPYIHEFRVHNTANFNLIGLGV